MNRRKIWRDNGYSFTSSERTSPKGAVPKGRVKPALWVKAGIDLLHKSLKRLAGSAGNIVKNIFSLLNFS